MNHFAVPKILVHVIGNRWLDWSLVVTMERNYIFKIKFLFNGILIIAFIVHISYIGYYIMNPDTPSVRVFTRDLKNFSQLPVSFKLCAEEQTNMNHRYRKFGYDNLYSFYQGRKKAWHGNWFGWAGHDEKNKTLGTVIGKM